MNKIIQVLNLAFLGAISISFTVAMICSDGKADINSIGEGWLEATVYGVLAILNLREVL